MTAGIDAVTWLFVPGNAPHRFAKAATAGADAVIVDWEDAVRPENKTLAREETLRWLGSGGRAWVRVNAVDTDWFIGDIDAIAGANGVLGVVLPKAVPVEMSLRDVEDAVSAFANAARRADEAGYEALELQAAHGYLIHTFLSPLSNRRTDRYGGSQENRFRFLLEVVDRVRAVWPSGKALFVRLSCVDVEWTIDQTVDLVRELQRHGVDLVDCSSGGLTGVPAPGTEPGYGYQVPYAEEIRLRTGVATMAVGYIVHAAQAQSIIESGQADLVALGRELLHNPHWPIDAARKLNLTDPYSHAPARIAHWLRKRDESFPDFTPSTG
ncbi:aldolase/citrate lyase family protein [Lentzea albida]|uniref:HpcH/HpaI aldolase/citrate lyase family protein n=1 Tax=Lentzea albida TaxID=65499 RepID=A0A1H9X517_9PSEU|nr:aldolase/citrate lyase family protein [Lentzea albida]SES41242.1 HpcH/HpaI aldolase/citrate lyase family protein [Lentzea albida]